MSIEPLPIIFFHKGNQDFIKYSLLKAKEENPDSRVILLGDESNRWLGEEYDVEWHNYTLYKDRAQNELVKCYKHMSTNPAHYELICIARWFFTYDFVMMNSIDSAFIADTDVLLFCDVAKQKEKHFKNYRCTLTNNISAGISFINDVSVLGEYCQFVLDSYSGKDKFHFDKAKSHYECLKGNGKPGGVADLTWWGLMKQKNPGEYGETTFVTNEMTTFDHCLGAIYGYESESGIKKIKYKEVDGKLIPFCKHLRLQKDVRFNCLHFQGVSGKPMIEKIYNKCRSENNG